MSLIVTAEELEERITSTTTTFRFGKMFKVLVVEEVPEAFFGFLWFLVLSTRGDVGIGC